MDIRCCRLVQECGVNCESGRESCCQSISVRAKGGLERGKGRAVGSGLDCQAAWKVVG